MLTLADGYSGDADACLVWQSSTLACFAFQPFVGLQGYGFIIDFGALYLHSLLAETGCNPVLKKATACSHSKQAQQTRRDHEDPPEACLFKFWASRALGRTSPSKLNWSRTYGQWLSHQRVARGLDNSGAEVIMMGL